MIRSMTAFAREELKLETGVITWEIRSVNHRYLEPFVRLPEDFRFMENDVRERLKQKLHRGKVECGFSFNKAEHAALDAMVNNQNLKQLKNLMDVVELEYPNLRAVSPLEILKWPGILDAKSADVEEIAQQSLNLLDQAIDDLLLAREREGEKLRIALEERLNAISEIELQVRQRLPGILRNVRERLLTRFEELKLQVDNDRVEQEMVIVTQKSDVEEELKRLETHLHEVQRILSSNDKKPVGRRLDFLMQELNREANTLCSKSMDTDTTRAGIDLKVYIEQMREQVQNIE